MRMIYRWKILFILGILCTLSLPLGRLDTARAQSGSSSCLACHEIEGKNPVLDKGDWHIQHNQDDLCAVCHGGDAKAGDQTAAHTGMSTDPLANAAITCAICHPDDWANRVELYAAILATHAADTQQVVETTPTEAATPTVAVQQAATLAPGSPAPYEETPPIYTPAPTHIPTPTAAKNATPVPAGPLTTPPPSGGVVAPVQGWFEVLRLARGPLFKAALWIFALGMLYRLAQALRPGWLHPRTRVKSGRLSGIGLSFLKGLLVLPFIPWMNGAFRRSPVTYIAGGLFHLGLLGVVIFSKTHMQAWKSVIGFGWPVLPAPVVSWLAAAAVLSMLALLVNRFVSPVLRLITGTAEWLNWLFVFLPMATGFLLARRLWLPYEVMFSVHMLLVDFLLVWIPLSRLSHFMFYFFARAIHGVEFEARGKVQGT